MYDGYAALVPRRPAEPDGPMTASSLVALIEKIEEAIAAETASIRAEPRFDIAASNARKGRHLYDLNRALKSQTPGAVPSSVDHALTSLRARLDENSRVIAAHLSAVTEVAALIKGAIQRSETDGTYSESHFGRSM